jgi:hypothetical protein
VLGLTFGELFLLTFIVGTILSARYWPRLGEWVLRRIARSTGDSDPE